MHETIAEWWKNLCRPMESHWYFWGFGSTDRDHCASLAFNQMWSTHSLFLLLLLQIIKDSSMNFSYRIGILMLIFGFSYIFPCLTHIYKNCCLYNLTFMPYPFSHFYIDINFGDRLYSKEKRPDSPLLFEYNLLPNLISI